METATFNRTGKGKHKGYSDMNNSMKRFRKGEDAEFGVPYLIVRLRYCLTGLLKSSPELRPTTWQSPFLVALRLVPEMEQVALVRDTQLIFKPVFVRIGNLTERPESIDVDVLGIF